MTGDLEAVVDLGEIRRIKTITVGFLSDQEHWIFPPAAVEYSLGSTRENMRTVFAKKLDTVKTTQAKIENVSAQMKSARARYVRVKAKNIGLCPAWHPGAGRKAWLFVDEIMVK